MYIKQFNIIYTTKKKRIKSWNWDKDFSKTSGDYKVVWHVTIKVTADR